MQKEQGKSRQGRPDSLTGKKGWGIRDTAAAKRISYKHAYDLITWGLKLRTFPNFDNRVSSNSSIRSSNKIRMENLLGTIKTTIFILKKDKRTLKIGNDLEKALKEYES